MWIVHWIRYDNRSPQSLKQVHKLCFKFFSGDSLWCYECGTEIDKSISGTCKYFEIASGWAQFKRECGEDTICIKVQSHGNSALSYFEIFLFILM